MAFYIVGHDALMLNGDIPIECKCSSDFPSVDEPPKYLGVDQLHASMDILNADYGILIVCTNRLIYAYIYTKKMRRLKASWQGLYWTSTEG